MNETRIPPNILAPIVKSISVRLQVEAAFDLFTEGVSRWWPLSTHSVWGDDAVSCHLEGRVGGRFYEVNRDGLQSDWGQVRVWEPPRRVVFSFNPGRSPDTAQQVEVTFQPDGGGIRVTLTHSEWELFGPRARELRDNYDHGWNTVLNRFISYADSGASR